MSIIKDILGGLLIVLVAGIIGVAQNAIRSDGMPLIPRNSASAVGKQEVSTSSRGDRNAAGEEPTEGTSVDAGHAGGLTAEELAAGRVARDRLKALLESGSIVLIDARTPREYETGHIAGAINIPYENFVDHYARLGQMVPYGSVIVCYCQSETCDDSENLARELKFMGYDKVLLYKGGWDEWRLAGYPASPDAAGE